MIKSLFKNAVLTAAVAMVLVACQPDSHPVPSSPKTPSIPSSPPGPNRRPLSPPVPRSVGYLFVN